MDIKILYEDRNILVIDKPAGISVHADGRTKEKTITDWVLENYPKMKGVGEPMGDIDRPGIVHRLDRDTSGVLLLAKNQKAHEWLKNQFQEHTIRKVYNCIVNGWVKNERGVVNKPIGRSPSDFRRRLSGRGARGEMREAITEYKVLKRFTDEEGEKFTVLEVRPKTGRTHQIRVHMKYLNHPIVADSLYNPDKPIPKGIKRLALHAKSIEFEDLKGERVKVESKLPSEFDFKS
ncbi:MAG: RluA family pseudouridine synthase [Candidatus Pacebacteria bacterium]|nr:RluA family pseudouridine synthase [Candidatus Paceibacterota bacterium]MBP9851159.1 RluA family pseudouridine synthase [Candidatus Paceibacterota bacterium]